MMLDSDRAQSGGRKWWWAVAAAVCVALPAISWGGEGRWTESDFYRKARATHPFVVVPSNDPSRAQTVIGGTRQYYVKKGDTFLDIARFYGLGYNEIEMANPGVDPWIPPAGKPIVLPT